MHYLVGRVKACRTAANDAKVWAGGAGRHCRRQAAGAQAGDGAQQAAHRGSHRSGQHGGEETGPWGARGELPCRAINPKPAPGARSSDARAKLYTGTRDKTITPCRLGHRSEGHFCRRRAGAEGYFRCSRSTGCRPTLNDLLTPMFVEFCAAFRSCLHEQCDLLEPHALQLRHRVAAGVAGSGRRLCTVTRGMSAAAILPHSSSHTGLRQYSGHAMQHHAGMARPLLLPLAQLCSGRRQQGRPVCASGTTPTRQQPC